jgi:hypothetical protein
MAAAADRATIRSPIDDGTKATKDQMAKDVAAFLTWTAEPKMERTQDRRLGVADLPNLIFTASVLSVVPHDLGRQEEALSLIPVQKPCSARSLVAGLFICGKSIDRRACRNGISAAIGAGGYSIVVMH